ncbi:MAG: hypothetical protein M3O00_01285 [Pseudomonadota bacterium]|jgi:hypothetical protein|nr:hypothetical protein [Pseudomonadota bacterium]
MREPIQDDGACFEALLVQILADDERAQLHQMTKHLRNAARQYAVNAKASFERNRDRSPKLRSRKPRRQD